MRKVERIFSGMLGIVAMIVGGMILSDLLFNTSITISDPHAPVRGMYRDLGLALGSVFAAAGIVFTFLSFYQFPRT